MQGPLSLWTHEAALSAAHSQNQAFLEIWINNPCSGKVIGFTHHTVRLVSSDSINATMFNTELKWECTKELRLLWCELLDPRKNRHWENFSIGVSASRNRSPSRSLDFSNVVRRPIKRRSPHRFGEVPFSSPPAESPLLVPMQIRLLSKQKTFSSSLQQSRSPYL